jgi:hypothetical protein
LSISAGKKSRKPLGVRAVTLLIGGSLLCLQKIDNKKARTSVRASNHQQFNVALVTDV